MFVRQAELVAHLSFFLSGIWFYSFRAQHSQSLTAQINPEASGEIIGDLFFYVDLALFNASQRQSNRIWESGT